MASGKPSILLVDDNAVHTRVLAKNLSLAGFSVITADTAIPWLEPLEAGKFDVFIVDLLLSKVCDLDLVVWSRRTVPQLRVVVMSDIDSCFLEKQVTSKGAHLFARKPVDLNRVVQFLVRSNYGAAPFE